MLTSNFSRREVDEYDEDIVQDDDEMMQDDVSGSVDDNAKILK